MDDQQLQELKQFIDSRIAQAEARIGEDIGGLDGRVGNLESKFGPFETKLEELRQEMLDGFTGVGEAIDEINKHVDDRLSKLEQQAV